MAQGANVNIPFVDISSKKKDLVVVTELEKQNLMQDVEFYQKKLTSLTEQFHETKALGDGHSEKLSDIAWEIQIKKEGLEHAMKMLVDSQN